MRYYTTKEVIEKYQFTQDFMNQCLSMLRPFFQEHITRGDMNSFLFDSEAMNVFAIIAEKKEEGLPIPAIGAFLLQSSRSPISIKSQIENFKTTTVKNKNDLLPPDEQPQNENLTIKGEERAVESETAENFRAHADDKAGMDEPNQDFHSSSVSSSAGPEIENVSIYCLKNEKADLWSLFGCGKKLLVYGRIIFFKLFISIVSVLMIAGGYWAYVKIADYNNKPFASIRNSTKSPMSETSQRQDMASLLTFPNEEVNQVIANLRKANLTKNIDLFLSCYSPKFPSLNNKKLATISNWEEYDYKSLNYHIKNLSLNEGNLSTIVQWTMTAYSHKKGKLVSMNMTFKVIMQRENGIFKIVYLEKLH